MTKITAYDPSTGDKLKTFDSVSEGAEYFKTHQSAISQVLMGLRFRAGGVCWRYEGQSTPEPLRKAITYDLLCDRGVERIDPITHSKTTYQNAIAAASDTPYATAESIVRCCLKEKKTAGKFSFNFL